ncbi:MAG: hypothetical protein GF393_04535 [Armatimonadia bacterium]|nr:hypothetical protein [Armatimonadia bacterium]
MTLGDLFEQGPIDGSAATRFLSRWGSKMKKSPSAGASDFVGVSPRWAIVPSPLSPSPAPDATNAMALAHRAELLSEWMRAREVYPPGERAVSPGRYHIASVPWSQWRKFEFFTGYWRWSKSGPERFSPSQIARRFLNGNCTKKVTRVKCYLVDVPQPSVSVTVRPGRVTDVELRPSRLIYVPRHGKFSNSDSRAFGNICKVVDKTPVSEARVSQIIGWILSLFE